MEENILHKRPKEQQAKVLRKVRITTEENVVRAKEMADLSIKQEVEESIQTLAALQSLFDENPSEEVAVELARGLRWLCGRASAVQGQVAYGGLQSLGMMYVESRSVLEEQAKGILNLCAKLDETSALVYKAQLQGVLFACPELADVIENYQPNGD